MSNEFFKSLEDLRAENKLDIEVAIESVKSALQKAAQKAYNVNKEDVRVDVNVEKKILAVYILRKVVEGEPKGFNEISLEEARTIRLTAFPDDILEYKVDVASFSRNAASQAKQSIRSDLREINRGRIVEKFRGKEHEIITATITRVDPNRSATLMYDHTELYLLRHEQIPGEELEVDQLIRVYVTGIETSNKKPGVKISRAHKDMVKHLFELEVPEIKEGIVEIKAVSREAGFRSKMAVVSNDPKVDAVGTCIGPKGARISAVVEELNGEKIDIIPYSDVPEEFIAKALAPAKVISVTIEEEDPEDDEKEKSKKCRVIVPNDQLSLAIGHKGQNAKLAAKLTGYKIDIKPENPVEEEEAEAVAEEVEDDTLFSDAD